MQKSQLFYCLLFCLLIWVSGCKSKGKDLDNLDSNKPNIVFILADDLSWTDLPSYGNTFNEAPSITKLVRQGMQFNNAYAANPVCSPSRASIQSGEHPARLGINDFIWGHWRPYEKVIVPQNETQYLPTQITTIAESLQKVGYATGYFGKWHLGGQPKHRPSSQGYDKSYVYKGRGYYNSKFQPEIGPEPEGVHPPPGTSMEASNGIQLWPQS